MIRRSSTLMAAALWLVALVAGAEGPDERAVARLGLTVDHDLPLEIGAEELEFVRGENGAETIHFRKDVELVQGTLRILADRVEAVYPKGASGRPNRILASGNVRLEQEGVRGRCDRVTYDGRCSVVCSASSGTATLQRGDDLLQGEEIHFDLCNGTLRARGRIRVQLYPKAPGEPGPEDAGG